MSRIKSENDFQEPGRKVSLPGHQVWLFLAGALGATFVALAIFYVWLYIQKVQNGYRLSDRCREYEELLAVQRKLKLEWTRFQDPFQLEQMGREQFKLAPPTAEQRLLMR